MLRIVIFIVLFKNYTYEEKNSFFIASNLHLFFELQ